MIKPDGSISLNTPFSVRGMKVMEKYQKVKIINNKYMSDGIIKNAIGYILEIYDEKYCEVEFLAKDGSTIAVQAINVDDFIVIDS